MTLDAATKARKDIEIAAGEIVEQRGNPLLVMFFPDNLTISTRHLSLLHDQLKAMKLSRSSPLEQLDVLLHTVGGDPIASYRLAQAIRDFTKCATFLVPEYAYSGGTLICLAGDEVQLGAYAVLSPIDITVQRSRVVEREHEPRFPSEDNRRTEVELVAIDHFMKAAAQARIEVEREFRLMEWTEAKSDAESAMLRAMVEQLGALEIAKIYREKNVTQDYARQLLKSYLLSDAESHDIERAVNRLVVDTPSHEFHMDYHLCRDIGLPVGRMTEELSDLSKDLVLQLDPASQRGWIGESGRPFFQYFPQTHDESEPAEEDTDISDDSQTTPTEADHGARSNQDPGPEHGVGVPAEGYLGDS
jgi:hypothetical protein